MKLLNCKKEKDTGWQGYTYDQLIYERALALTRIEIEKERTAADSERVRRGNFLLSRSLFSRLVSALSYADFIVLGVRLWRKMSPLFSKKS